MSNLWPAKRASHMGTFGMSLSGFDDVAFASYHLGPNSTILGVDVVARGGKSSVLLTFDHRILDGKPVMDILKDLERNLRGPILEEVRTLAVKQREQPEAAADYIRRAA
jgi:pyruvate/2-oxoglutarate dehydrogenase complex dihydrolipoamide acyltransferase (E2) component